MPKGCSIQLEEIAARHVLENINSRLRKNEFYMEMVKELAAASGAIPTLEEFFQATAIDPHTFYNEKHTYVRLLADAGLIPDFPVTEEEEALRKSLPRVLSMDSPKWISFMEKCYETMPAVLTEMERKYLRMWQLTLYPEGGKWTCAAPEEAVLRFQGQKELTKELKNCSAGSTIISTLSLNRQACPMPPRLKCTATTAGTSFSPPWASTNPEASGKA